MKTVVGVATIETVTGTVRSVTVALNEIVANAIEALFGRCPQNAGRFVQFLVIWFKCRSNY